MRLREMVGTAYALLDLSENEVIPVQEMIRYLSDGELQVANALLNSQREKFMVRTTIAAVDAQADYDLPIDTLEVVRIEYAGAEGIRIPAKVASAMVQNRGYEPIKGYQQFYVEVKGTLGKAQFTLYPTPDDTTNITVWYYQKPLGFHIEGMYEGALTAAVSETVFNDAKIPFAGASAVAGIDDFWNGAILRFVSGLNRNQERYVLDFTEDLLGVYGSLTVETGFPNVPTAGDEFEIDQVSIIPDQHHPLVTYWAAIMGGPKAQKDPAIFEKLFSKGMESITLGHRGDMDGPIPTLVTQGAE